MEWMVAAFFFWVLQQLAKSHPLTKPFTLKPSERWKSPVDVIYPKLHLPPPRRKRSTKADDHSLLVLKTTNDTFYIKLKANDDLVDPNRLQTSSDQSTNSCHYHGTVLSHQQGSAAISVCGPKKQLSGVIVTGNNAYVLRAHIIMKMDNPFNEYCGGQHKDASLHFSENEISEERQRIKRSSTEKRKVIETAIYVDYPLYHKLSVKKQQSVEEMQNTVLAILNEVQLIYNYQSLNTKFKIVVVKLDILTEGEEGPDAADGDIDLYLDNFCSWQSSKNPPINSELHWDHALMLSGYDLHKLTPGNEKNKKVLGLAWVNGMCRPKHSCTLNEGSSFEAAFVIAHEMGHSLGMMHDGRGNDCDPSAYLMSEKTGPGRITWSTCSNDYLDRFFQKGYGACLDDDNSHVLESVSRALDDKMPGERFDLEAQCKLSLGDEFKPHVVPKTPFNNVCRELWCVSGLWASVAHPALEGSSCGTGKQCIQGKCKNIATAVSSPSNAEIVEDMKGAVAEFLEKLKSAFHLLVS
ncbi:a disintegrin and metalloproteinase with thrombospondin motifs adt-1 [Caerostris darwini]|uniref:A disintegrin and metalloproteinase with thrombospondin motifs adt-1 n=1 Tax=Caerostris darwini TaxID=1538125 RepID=A0AAV4QPI7_9ARAC|nr:a disintegrin and metalloproteinase with thrombospondin motifs adt-1 [Caerostris darwini]